MRNPVGPLPSTIYWRRRAVAACLAALLTLLGVWALASSRGDGKKTNDAANGGVAPSSTASPALPSITPGPSGTGKAISQQPGGRDESDAGDGTATPEPGASGGTDAGTADGTGKNGDTDGAGGDGGAGTGAGRRVPADSPLPNCTPAALQLSLRSSKVRYEAGEKPRFLLAAKNTSSTDCKADFGPRNAVLTISDSKDDEVWSTADCPAEAAPVLLRLPAHSTVTHTVDWDRKRSDPRCTRSSVPTGPDTYLVEATMPGMKVLPASFSLAKD
nr:MULTISPECIES: hypothetical protein [unclassified Streptomyces]